MNDSLYRDLGVLRQLTDRWNKNKLLTAVWPGPKDSLCVTNFEHTMVVRPKSTLLFDFAELAYPIDTIHRVLGQPVVRRAAEKEVTFHHYLKERCMDIEWPGGSERIPAIDEKIPLLPADAPYRRSCKIEIPADSFEFVSRAMSTEVVRYALGGILIDGDKKNIVASDGKRLHIRPFTSELTFQKLILKSDAVWAMVAAQDREEYASIHKIGLEKEDPVKMFSLDIGHFTLYSKPIEGHFPDYGAVIPKEFHGQVVLSAPQWRDALKSFRSFFRENKPENHNHPYHRVRLDMTTYKDAVRLVAMVDKKETAKRVDLIEGNNRMLLDGASFNGDFLLDASWNENRLVLQTNGPTEAIVIDGQAIVMPLTLGDGFTSASTALTNKLKGQKRDYRLEKYFEKTSTWNRRKAKPDQKEEPVEPKIVRKPIQKPQPAPRPKAAVPKQVLAHRPAKAQVIPAPAPAPKPAPPPVQAAPKKRLRDYDFSTTTPGLW